MTFSSFFSPWRFWLLKFAKAGAVLFLSVFIFLQFYRSLPNNELRDFGSFYASGQAISQGLNPYGVHKLTYHLKFKFFEGDNPNLNPPISLLLFNFISMFNVFTMFRVCWIISFLLFALSIGLIVRFYHQQVSWWLLLLILAMPGSWDTLFLGQIYMPLLLATIAAWLFLENNQGAWAGILIGTLAAFKPNFLCWPALLFLAGHRKVAFTAGGFFLLLSSIPILIYGFNVYDQWIHLILKDNPARIAFPTNVSLFGLAYRGNVGWVALPIGLIILIAVGILTWRRKPPALETSAMAIATSILVSPLAWIHYCLFLIPLFFYLPRTTPMKIGLMLLAFPLFLVFWSFLGPATLKYTTGSIYNWAAFLIFIETLRIVFNNNYVTSLNKSKRNMIWY